MNSVSICIISAYILQYFFPASDLNVEKKNLKFTRSLRHDKYKKLSNYDKIMLMLNQPHRKFG